MEHNLSESSKQSETASSSEPNMENPCSSFPLASFELLKKYRSGLKRLSGEKLNEFTSETNSTQKLPTEEVMRIATDRFIHYTSGKSENLPRHCLSFMSSIIDFTDEDTNDIELIHILLDSAEKVGEKQYERANNLLKCCYCLSSSTGNPVQRVVYYFSRALGEIIDRETGKITLKDTDKKQIDDLEEAMMGPNPVLLAVYQQLPFSRVGDFTGVQAIVDNVVEVKKVHLIDFTIRCGVHSIILMQALANRHKCPVDLLRITAVVTNSKSRVEETGKRLMSFAQKLKLTFSFKIVLVKDMLDLSEELFELREDETVAIYSRHFLWTMIEQPNHLENLMRVVKKINPSVMLVVEVEADHNSPIFFERFMKALFSYSAYFDSLDNCMCKDDPNRTITESVYLGEGIRKVVAPEGEERTVRHVKIGVWREFFEKLGMREMELTELSLYQASFIIKDFGCGNNCTLDMDGKCLIVGWKGTPVHSLSAWKFM